MAECNATTRTSSGLTEIFRLRFAQNAAKINHRQSTTLTASDRTEQQGTARIANNAASRAAENIGHGPYIQLFLRRMRKHAKFVMLINHLRSFTQMAVSQMAQKNTAADAKVVYLQEQSKNNQSCTYQNLNGDLQAQKTLSPASLTTPRNANSTLGSILILFTCLSFTQRKKAYARYLELK